MKAAVVNQPGQAPHWGDFEAPQTGKGEVIVDMVAAALSQLARARASGTHYSLEGVETFVAGVDGVGYLTDDTAVYCALPRAPYGTMAQHVPVRTDHMVALPKNMDPVQAAAIANPGMSSWAALTERAHILAGETVLINGATGISGQLAVRIARHLGAGRIIATGRNTDMLDSLDADETIDLKLPEAAVADSFSRVFATRVDIVLDYLWGPSARSALIAAARHGPEGRRLRFVQIGTSSANDIALPGAVLRSSAIELMGSGIGSVSTARLLSGIGQVFDVAQSKGWQIPLRTVPMPQVEQAWASTAPERLVLTL